MTEQTNESLIISEVNKLIDNTQKSIEHLKAIAISEAWKLLQLAVSTIIQIIESIGKDMEGAEKKKLAMELINDFYDKVFLVVDIPYLPSMLESYLHNYVKKFLMILVSSTIDSMVTIFRNTGVFLKK